MNRMTTGPGDLLDVLRVLLLLQAALYLVFAIEALVFAGFFGPSALGAVALSLAVTLGLLIARARLDRLARRGRRLLAGFEGLLLAVAVLDAGLALLAAGQLLGLVPALTRGVLPIAIVLLLRRLVRTPAEPASPAFEATHPPAADALDPGVLGPATRAEGAA